jgi:GAF domain-containing protein
MKNTRSIFDIQSILPTQHKPDAILAEITQAIAILLQVDRCFLYVRDPQSRYGQAAFCYCRNPDVPDVSSVQWLLENPANLEDKDPMFAAALNCKPTIYVEDVETAASEIVNSEFEAQEFGHRALIHGHLCEDEHLWGILQPCVFNHPRHWTAGDRQIMETMVSCITPLIKQYVKQKEQKS